MTKKPKALSFDPEYVRDISVEVYMERLGKRDTQRVLNDPERGLEHIRKNAVFYDPQVTAALRAINKRHSLELGVKHGEAS